jgi:hypothetical protein
LRSTRPKDALCFADRIDADQDASGALAGLMINADQIDRATFTGKYGRK